MRADLDPAALLRLCAALVLLAAAHATSFAAGPRWVSGPPFFWTQGLDVAWYTNSLTYYTDPGDLSASVPHAAADALVAGAAAVWNVPTASLVLAQGGSLAEHVTGALVTANGGAVPPDAASSNWQSIPIAVIYDTDGSVIDDLLGAGGSDPSGCLQNGVVDTVDLIGQNSTIEHALIILNGRCTGADPQLQTQLQYQLVRAFGRVLGLGWSQTNDNVFTGSPQPTSDQAQNWPIMHPLDIICGPHTYQCMPNPFTLRADDLSALAELYFIPQGQGASFPGKQDSLAGASELDGWVYFPDGTGMEGVNVTVRRHKTASNYIEPWQTVSAVTGFSFRQATGTPIAGVDGSAASSVGTYEGWREGYWRMERLPIFTGDQLDTTIMSTEPVNPLYTGPYALASAFPASSTIAPSGSPISQETDLAGAYYGMRYALTAADAVPTCTAANDGTEVAPVAMPPSGWWTGVLCGFDHTAWTTLNFKLNHSFAIELTALNETGAASAVKTMPMIGLWQSSDATGQGPTVAATPAAFNSSVTGMSVLALSSAPASSLRMAFADARGKGRPDFAYQARVLYADAVTPANVGPYGGTVVISGTGFRPGMVVTINGYAAVVLSATPTTLTVHAPSLQGIGASRALLAPVTVTDPATGSATTIMEALGYGSPGERLLLRSAPSGTVIQGRPTAAPLAVQVLAGDGVTPVAGETVTFSFTAGSGTFGICGASSCTVQTDSNGLATTPVTPTSLGGIALRAATPVLGVSASIRSISSADTITLTSSPTGTSTVGAPATVPFTVRILAADGVTPRPGQTVTVTAENAAATLAACSAFTCNLRTDPNGFASTPVIPLAAGTVALDATSAAGSVRTTFTAANAVLSLVSAPSGLLPAGQPATTPFAVRVLAPDGVTPIAGETVTFQVTAGTATFTPCTAPVCTVLTDATGLASISVTPTSAGAVTITAGTPVGSLTTSLIGVVLPARIQLVSLPATPVYAGELVSPGLVARLTLADGITPVAGQAITFSVAVGSASLGVCGNSSCTVTTDANGLFQTPITPGLAGALVLAMTPASALEAAPGTAALTVLARERSVTAVQPVQYVAEGVSASWTGQFAVSDNAGPTTGVPLTWSGTGLDLSAVTAVGPGGLATATVGTAGLGAGVRATASVCAWLTVCSGVAAEGVSATRWTIQIVAGAAQQISATGTLTPVTLRLTDGAGHGVLGAPVTLHQQLTAWQQPCPAQGRCPPAAVLSQSTSTVLSDSNGLLTLAPLQQPGTPGTTVIAAIAGTAALTTFTLVKTP